MEISWTYHVKNAEVLQRVTRKGTFYIQGKEEKRTGFVTSWVGTAF
jgi:hypothetical protein